MNTHDHATLVSNPREIIDPGLWLPQGENLVQRRVGGGIGESLVSTAEPSIALGTPIPSLQKIAPPSLARFPLQPALSPQPPRWVSQPFLLALPEVQPSPQAVTSPPSGSAAFELGALNGANGFTLNGIDVSDFSGNAVGNAGDLNGDGFDDIIIGAYLADPNGKSFAGESYVVFGSSSPSIPQLALSSLNGVNGFVINGVDIDDRSGSAVSGAGDINGDGLDDLIIGARRADPNGKFSAGESYVILGRRSGFSPTLELSNLNGINGFAIHGIDSLDEAGISVGSAGDVNGDGLDDLVIGAANADPNNRINAGESYIIFGRTTSPGPVLELSTLNGSNGFTINGIDITDVSGTAVGSAGDINQDGFDDIIIGAHLADPHGQTNAGEIYVVFGGSNFSTNLNLSSLNGSNGFVIHGIDSQDYAGMAVGGAGDINGDGFDDIIVGAPLADPNGQSNGGESYVIFGRSGGFSASLDLSSLDGSNGLILRGMDSEDRFGSSVAGAGDMNGDGFDDVIIGASFGDANANLSGESYVIFGGSSLGPILEISNLDVSNGFILKGIDANDYAGIAVDGGGDVNGDGFDDVIIGASLADDNASLSGESYVVFGGPALALNFTGTPAPDTLVGNGNNNILVGGSGFFDNLTGKGGSDTFQFTALADKGDLIVDFTPGVDLIDIRAIFSDLNLSVTTYAEARSQGYLTFGRSPFALGGTIAYIDPTQSGLQNPSLNGLFLAAGVGQLALDSAANFLVA